MVINTNKGNLLCGQVNAGSLCIGDMVTTWPEPGWPNVAMDVRNVVIDGSYALLTLDSGDGPETVQCALNQPIYRVVGARSGRCMN